jgi:hypothetical protein
MKKIAAISSVLLGLVFLAGCSQQPESQTQPMTPTSVAQAPAQPVATTITPIKQIPMNWDVIQFDTCGKKTKYEKLSWWNKFSSQVGKFNYYTDGYIELVLKQADYLHPSNVKYNQETYCSEQNNQSSVICNYRKDVKLSINDFGDYGEGCLSKDGSAFIAVFPGEYMGGGNYIFRYDIASDNLEAAQKVNESQPNGSGWIDPPTTFGKRIGNIIKMTGGNSDAGCGSTTDFDYNIVTNQLKMTKRCNQCAEEKTQCNVF